jgi:DNA-binding IscR family transcriptional regulator
VDEDTCAVRIVMQEVRDATARILDNTTLYDINARQRRTRRRAPPRSARGRPR